MYAILKIFVFLGLLGSSLALAETNQNKIMFLDKINAWTKKLNEAPKFQRSKEFQSIVADIRNLSIAQKESMNEVYANLDNDISLAETQQMLSCLPESELKKWPHQKTCKEFKSCVVREFGSEPPGLPPMLGLLKASGCAIDSK